jgi:hypothetical protein
VTLADAIELARKMQDGEYSKPGFVPDIAETDGKPSSVVGPYFVRWVRAS